MWKSKNGAKIFVWKFKIYLKTTILIPFVENQQSLYYKSKSKQNISRKKNPKNCHSSQIANEPQKIFKNKIFSTHK